MQTDPIEKPKGMQGYSQKPTPASKTSNINEFATSTRGRVHDEIGAGEEAKSGIVWKSIQYSFWIGTAFSFATILFFIFSFANNHHPLLSFPLDEIKGIWAIFIPIITLALGYIFGKGGK
jgi:hypothetical protein